MIAILKNDTTPVQIDHLISWLKKLNLEVHISKGQEMTILGLVGDTSRVDIELTRNNLTHIVLPKAKIIRTLLLLR